MNAYAEVFVFQGFQTVKSSNCFFGSYTAVAGGGLCQPIVCPDQSTSIYGSVVSFEYELAMSKVGSMSPPLVYGIYWEQDNATPPASVDASSVLAYFPLASSVACMIGSDGASTPVTTSRYVFTNKDKVTIPPVTDGKVGFFRRSIQPENKTIGVGCAWLYALCKPIQPNRIYCNLS